jgi:hypothetical protein
VNRMGAAESPAQSRHRAPAPPGYLRPTGR